MLYGEMMSKEYASIMQCLNESIDKLRDEIPDVMSGFSLMASAAKKKGALDEKTKEFIALALGISAHCDGCIGFHSRYLFELGASRDEILEILGMSIYLGGGPALMYAAEALEAYEQACSASKEHE